jgi:hypothetical protein
MVVRLFLTLAIAIGLAAAAAAQDTASFAGKWSGSWTNSVGENGNSSLKLSEDADGILTGTWDGVEVKDERINKNTIELRGKNATRSYQLTCTVTGRTMSMKYVVTRLNMDGSYDGRATLKRE